MKPTTQKKLLPIIALSLMAGTFTAVNAGVKPYRNFATTHLNDEEKKPARKERTTAKKTTATKFALNNKVVKLYPDIIKREMHVVIKENNEERELDFFVFSTDGTLMQQHRMKPKEHKRITGLEKGKYIYRVFDGDEETATGKFEIR